MKATQRAIGIVLVLVMLVACLPLIGTEVSAARSDGYLTLNEAAQQIKQHMLDRNTDNLTLKVYVEDSRPLGDAQIQELFEALVFRHTGVPTEGDYLRYCHLGTSYSVLERRQEGNKHWLTLIFSTQYYQSAARENTVTAKAKEILASLNLNGKSDYEKIHAIYSYICKNVDYDLNYEQLTPYTQEYNDIYSAYGAIVNNKAVCEGYALAMYRLLLEAGIDNRVLVSADHAWNVVKLGDKYYNLDSTWDYGIEPANFNWFLIGSADFTDVHHSTGEEFNTQEFLQAYPESPINYGAPATATGSGTCGDNATWTLTADGTLTISGSGPIRNTVDGETLWPGLNMYIKKVVIQQGITAIGDYAFWNCPQLSSVSIPSSVTAIGDMAFERCRSLKEITIPNSVTTMGKAVFSACTALEKVVLPNRLTEIREMTFNFCTSLKSLTIPGSVTTIGFGAFASAFDPNAKVSFEIPQTVTNVGYRAFAWTGLKSVVWNARTELLATDMFYMSKQLETVTLNESIKRFGTEIFSHCYSLKSVKMPSGLLEIEQYDQGIFLKCYALESVNIPKTLTKIDAGMFMDCMSLKEIQLHEGITEIGNMAFYNTGIKSIVIPKSVKTVGQWAFNSRNVESVTFTGDAPQFNVNGTFGSFGKTITVYYPGANSTWTEDVLNLVSLYTNTKTIGVHGENEPHTLGSTWVSDGSSHWKQCTGCDHKEQISGHSYTDSCDETCNVCGYRRSALHSYVWAHNADQHWCACKCGAYLVYPQAHGYQGGICSECGAKQGDTSTDTPPVEPPVIDPPVIEPDPPKPVDPEPDPPKPVDPEPTTPDVPEQSTPGDSKPGVTDSGEAEEEDAPEEFPWVVLAIGAVVIIGGVAAVIVVKKKKEK